MKALVCEMCGNNDLVKKDGYYVCQFCGTKYTVEEARKLMIEGKVDVSGSIVKIDTAEKTKNLFDIARNALADHDYESAANAYTTIAQDNPTNWEAIFFSFFCRSMLSTQGDIDSIIVTFGKVANRAIQLVFSSVTEVDARDAAIKQIAEKSLVLGGALHATAWNLYPSPPAAIYNVEYPILYKRQEAVRDVLMSEGYAMLDTPTATDGIIASGVSLLKGSLDIFLQTYKDRFDNSSAKYPDAIQSCAAIIKKHDPSFRLEKYYEESLNNRKDVLKAVRASGGCYIATAVYGSYDCPQVWVLRRYRDYTLAKTWYGRVFIRTYYAISPTLVKWFGDIAWVKQLWKGKLDLMVAGLRAKGVADTPYQDRNW